MRGNGYKLSKGQKIITVNLALWAFGWFTVVRHSQAYLDPLLFNLFKIAPLIIMLVHIKVFPDG